MRRALLAILEVIVLTALILVTRCANFRDVFVAGEIDFADADCYARMTRVRLCAERPGLILRHHTFENFPAGTTPHTTAPLDYLIVAVSAALAPFTAHAIDFAGALISPILGLLTGWFLWWWSRRERIPHRLALLAIYAISPILVHGTELGRPDHQSLVLALIAVALCAESSLVTKPSRGWSIASGVAWGFALWVSLYEPLILLLVVATTQLIFARTAFIARHRLPGWLTCAAILFIALVIERRLPMWPGGGEVFSNWARSIGELHRVALNDPVWLRWTGLLLLPLPALLWIAFRKGKTFPGSRNGPRISRMTRMVSGSDPRNPCYPRFLCAGLVISFALTIWQARWGYFFVLIFALSLPGLLAVIPNRIAGGVLVIASLFPMLQEWDERLWPDEQRSAAIMERRVEAAGFREIARRIGGPFLAPWWWSPAIAYWSEQPGVAGSSHEALAGIETTARFFTASNLDDANAILDRTQVQWVVAYDASRTVSDSAALLGISAPSNCVGAELDRHPSAAGPRLELSAQNSAAKLFRVRFFR